MTFSAAAQRERLELKDHPNQGAFECSQWLEEDYGAGLVACDWLEAKYLVCPRWSGGKPAETAAVAAFVAKPEGQKLLKRLAFEVDVPGYQAPLTSVADGIQGRIEVTDCGPGFDAEQGIIDNRSGRLRLAVHDQEKIMPTRRHFLQWAGAGAAAAMAARNCLAKNADPPEQPADKPHTDRKFELGIGFLYLPEVSARPGPGHDQPRGPQAHLPERRSPGARPARPSRSPRPWPR